MKRGFSVLPAVKLPCVCIFLIHLMLRKMASVNAEHQSLGRGVGKTKSIKPWYGLGGEGNAFLFLRAQS